MSFISNFVQRSIGIRSWDSVFIPINENGVHWFSACIHFRLKRIDIYDSLGENCVSNRQKPVPLRKNTGLMLVSLVTYGRTETPMFNILRSP